MIMGIIIAGTGGQQLLLDLDHSESWSLACVILPGWQANNSFVHPSDRICPVFVNSVNLSPQRIHK